MIWSIIIGTVRETTVRIYVFDKALQKWSEELRSDKENCGSYEVVLKETIVNEVIHRPRP